jgi:hypothetical protein
MKKLPFCFVLILLVPLMSIGKTKRVRAMWRGNTSNSIVIGWDQVSGDSPILYYSLIDLGKEVDKYPLSSEPSHQNGAKKMKNTFVRLENLLPNSVYYFVIRDSEGISRKYSFKTIPMNPSKLSIVAGGDSRNHREVRRHSNICVSKLRADFVLFSGDMTDGDTADEWKDWLDDWELTISNEGRITPIVVARGNHEKNNEGLYQLFDLPSPHCVYGLTFGQDLLFVASLNSLIAPGGKQKIWIETMLQEHEDFHWKFAQYHFPMRPHNSRKPEANEQSDLWAPIFEKYKLNLAIESDAHLSKITYPIVRNTGPKSQDGFMRDDQRGVTYIGEGGWGAPLRQNNDDKSWTVKSGSFNQIKWLLLDESTLLIRTIIMEDYSNISALDDKNRFAKPAGLKLWNVNGLEEYIIKRRDAEDGRFAFPRVPPPMRLNAFKHELNEQNQVMLSWKIAHERPGLSFQVERSIKNASYEVLETIKGLGPNPENKYELLDDQSFMGPVSYKLYVTGPLNKLRKEIGQVELDKPPPPIIVEREKTIVDMDGRSYFDYSVPYAGSVTVFLLNDKFEVLNKKEIPNLRKGSQTGEFDFSGLPNGRYNIIIKLNDELLKKILVINTGQG